MTNRLKSNSDVADSIKSGIEVQGAIIGQVNMGGGEKTNLIVMDKLNEKSNPPAMLGRME